MKIGAECVEVSRDESLGTPRNRADCSVRQRQAQHIHRLAKRSSRIREYVGVTGCYFAVTDAVTTATPITPRVTAVTPRVTPRPMLPLCNSDRVTTLAYVTRGPATHAAPGPAHPLPRKTIIMNQRVRRCYGVLQGVTLLLPMLLRPRQPSHPVYLLLLRV